MAIRLLSFSHLVALALLIAAGAVGNYLSIPLFFGADFLFGSIATFLVIRFYGVWWGAVAALLISSYTYVLWGHPYGLIIFVLEALVVGLLSRRWPRTSLLLLDGLYWVLIGIPLGWFSYGSLLQLDPTGVTLVVLKQSVNGLFNAMVAVLALTHLPLHRWLPGFAERFRIPIGEGFFNLLVTFLMIPALVLTIQSSRYELHRINEEIEHLLSVESRHAINEISRWRERYLNRLHEVGEVAATEGMMPSARLADTLTFLLATSPDFRGVSVVTPNGTIIASASKDVLVTVETDTINPNTLKEQRQPILSEVHTTLSAPDLPVITVNQPIVKNGQLVGIAQGLLNPGYAHALLAKAGAPLELTLVDRKGTIFGSSHSDVRSLQRFDPMADSQILWLGEDRYQRFPVSERASLNRWRESHEVLETAISGAGDWRLIAEVSLKPYRTRLYQAYINSLLTVLALIIPALLLSALLSRWITGPLLRLTTITRYLPERLKGGEPILWPSSSIAEVDSLSTDIRRMADVLRGQFDEIERDARQQRALLSTAMESTTTPVMITDEAERIVYVNPPFLEEYGYTPDEVLGRRPGSFLGGPFSDQKSLGRLREAIRLGRRITVDLINQRKDGTLVDVELILSPIYDAAGRTTHFVAIQRDIAARKAHERIKNQFVVSLSNEMRLPLTEIRGALSLLSTQAQNFDPCTERLIETATTNSQQLNSLIDRVLELEELESGRAELHRETVTANRLVSQAVQTIPHIFERAGVTLIVEVPDLPVVADTNRMGQVLVNLLAHAAACSGEGTRVTVTAKLVAGEVLFAIRDQGPGIPPAEVHRLFQAFDQGRLLGSSLGLAIARAVIEQLAGRIWVESEMGQGSSIFFTLNSGAAEEVQRPCSVLVYADRSICERVAYALEPEGIHVDEAQTADDAWTALGDHHYDAVLLEEGLPNGGRPFLMLLRQSEPYANLPVVLIDPHRVKEAGWSLLSSGAWVIDAHDETRMKQAVRYACGAQA